MGPEQMQTISQVAILIGTIIAAIGGYGHFHYDKIINNQKPMYDESINIEKLDVSDNKAPTQVNVGSPGSQQIINNKRVIKNNPLREKGTQDGGYYLRLTFNQTDGIWDSGTKFWMQLQLTGPYTSYAFVSGYPPTLPLSNVRTTSGIKEAANKGWIELETSTPPLNEPIVLEIKSTSDIDVEKILLQPTNGYTKG